MSVLPVVLSTVAATIILVTLSIFAWKAWSKFATILSSLPRIATGIDKYLEMEDHVKTVPALLEGQTKMCAAQIAAITELRKTVNNFKEAVFKRDDIRSLETPSDGEKNMLWEARRIQAENPGMDSATAMLRAMENEVKELNGAAGAGEFSL